MKSETPNTLAQRLTGNETKKVSKLCLPVIDWMIESNVHTFTIKRSGEKITLDIDARPAEPAQKEVSE